jgi:hypothetical protein
MIRIISSPIALLAILMLGGCSPRMSVVAPTGKKPVAKPASDRPHDQTQSKRAANPRNKRDDHTSWHQPPESWLPSLRADGTAPFVAPAGASWSAGAAFTESHAVERIERELKDALAIRPTLIVWLFDQSAAAGTIRRAVANAAIQMPARVNDSASRDAGNAGTAKKKLLTAIVAFGNQVKLLTPEPVEEAGRLPDPNSILEEPVANGQTYAALAKAAELYTPYRMRGHEVIFVLVAHGAVGHVDDASFHRTVSTLSRAMIPIFGIGPPAPFGRLADTATAGAKPDEESIGHESLYPERIKLFFPDSQGDSELSDSGYGPFNLERVCRATGGGFLRIRPGGSPAWATDEAGEIKPELLRRYAPDYVSEAEYKQILAENRACLALHEAAQLPAAGVLAAPTYDFTNEDDAAMQRKLSAAQRAAAENQRDLERLQQTLAAGETDRAKLTRPRWQAGYDLAFGRACAARARNDGYNQMLAILKNGKAFTKSTSTIWSLKPAEGIPGRSDLDKMARNAKLHLERVIKEHSGTPWVAAAARELAVPCGWEWTER